MDDGHLVVTPSATAKTDVTINVGAVSASVPYIVRFSVKGSSYSNQGSFGVRIYAGGVYARFQYYKILATRQEVEMLFTLPISHSSTILHFQPSEGGPVFYLDNIEMFQATATVTNPSDSIRFEYNDTKVNKVVSLTGNYMDVRGMSYTTGSITLLPFTSVVLVRYTGEAASIEVEPTITWVKPSERTYGRLVLKK